MENFYCLLFELQCVFGECLGVVVLNCYLVEWIVELVWVLVCYVGVGDEVGVMLGNGLDELIGLLMIVVVQFGVMVLVLVFGFVMYEVLVWQQWLGFVGVLLCVEDFQFDEVVMLVVIEQYWLVLVYLVCFNNLIGMFWDVVVIECIVVVVLGLVVMDEVYQFFVDKLVSIDSFVLMVCWFNVLVMCMMSKFGLVGVCIGYLFGVFELVGQVEKLCLFYNISVFNVEVVFFVLEYVEVYVVQVVELCQQCECVFQVLQVLFGVKVWFSQGNMIFVRVQDVVVIFVVLKVCGVLIKNVFVMYLLFVNCLCFMVGMFDENICLLVEFQSCLL